MESDKGTHAEMVPGNSYDNTSGSVLLELASRQIHRDSRKNEVNHPAPKNIDNLLAEKKIGEWLFYVGSMQKHCRQSPCHQACPTGAIMRNEFGGVYYQTDICMGCGMCIAACPFGVPESKSGHRPLRQVRSVLRPSA